MRTNKALVAKEAKIVARKPSAKKGRAPKVQEVVSTRYLPFKNSAWGFDWDDLRAIWPRLLMEVLEIDSNSSYGNRAEPVIVENDRSLDYWQINANSPVLDGAVGSGNLPVRLPLKEPSYSSDLYQMLGHFSDFYKAKLEREAKAERRKKVIETLTAEQKEALDL